MTVPKKEALDRPVYQNYETEVRSTDNLSLQWAAAQYNHALNKFLVISPVTTLAGARPGEVLISRSGNVRVILSIMRKGGDGQFHFLSRLDKDRVRFEVAQESKIDAGRIAALVVRRSGNPLERYAKRIKGLRYEEAVLHNVRVLLRNGAIGNQISSRLAGERARSGVFLEVGLFLSPQTGRIEGCEYAPARELCKPVSIAFNKLSIPSEDYIRSVAFIPGTEELIKDNLLLACVLANTIENARNLFAMGQQAGAV